MFDNEVFTSGQLEDNCYNLLLAPSNRLDFTIPTYPE